MALTCGEETNGAFNGAEWLTANRRDLIDAEFALNEGGGGDSDGKGKVVGQSVQVGEKTFANFRLKTRNPGGHSSVPVRANAIYQLSRALTRIDEHEFPVEVSETTRGFFARSGAGRNNDLGRAMVALAANPADKAAEAVVNTDPFLHSNLRTTCAQPASQRCSMAATPKCPAAARRGQRQLPHLPRPFDCLDRRRVGARDQ